MPTTKAVLLAAIEAVPDFAVVIVNHTCPNGCGQTEACGADARSCPKCFSFKRFSKATVFLSL